MLLAPPNTVFLLAGLVNFIYRTLNAGSDLKTILVLYDNRSSQLTSDILCSFRLHPLIVSWSTLNVNVPSGGYDIFKNDLPLTLAILQKELTKLWDGLNSLEIFQLKRNNVILIYPFEISDNDTFFAEFARIAERFPAFLVNYVDGNIKVIFHSMLFERIIFLKEMEFEDDVQNLFYHPLDNMQLQPINVFVPIDPPVTFHTQVLSGSSHLSERMIGIGGAELSLTQLIAECLNATAIFHTRKFNKSTDLDVPKWLDFISNKQLLPMKAPALPSIKNVNYLSLNEYYRHYFLDQRAIHFKKEFLIKGTSYPHTEVEYVFVLPNIVTVRSIVLSSMVRNPLFTVWAFIVTLVTVMRKLLHSFPAKVMRRSFSDLVFDSFGRAFGTSLIPKVSSIRSERILLIALSFVAVLAGIFCSGALIEQFSTNKYTQTIRNIDDLKSSDYTVYVPYEFDSELQEYFLEKFKLGFNNHSIDENSDVMYMYIWTEMHPEKYFAYLIPAHVCLWLGLYSAEGQKRYSILQPPFLRIQSRLNVMEERFQDAIELPVMRAVQHGFVEHFEKSCRNALVQEFGNIDDSTEDESSFKQGTIADLNFMFCCIGIGLIISCIIFVGELLFNKSKSKLRVKKKSIDLCGIIKPHTSNLY